MAYCIKHKLYVTRCIYILYQHVYSYILDNIIITYILCIHQLKLIKHESKNKTTH